MKKASSGTSVVICDDDRYIVDSLTGLLKEAGYRIEGTASNGLDLIRICEEKGPDIVIADIEMPLMNGIQASREVFDKGLAKCVIMLTSFDDDDYIKGAIESGVSGYLTKPVDPGVLVPTIERCLRKSEQLYEVGKKVANINKRIETRDIIEKAQLLLMENHKMSEADAYGYIKSLSKERGSSMADIAEIVIARYDG